MELVERPGYLGKRRDDYVAQLNARYGVDGWRFVWQWGVQVLNFVETCLIYEDAYYHYFMQNNNLLLQLTTEASDVYDDAPSNMDSGYDYMIQETMHTHVQDIAIRRCVRRLGSMFTGERPVQIRDSRGEHPLSLTLSPGQVLFHMPEQIVQPQQTGWWLPDSVEAFYQSNRYVAVG